MNLQEKCEILFLKGDIVGAYTTEEIEAVGRVLEDIYTSTDKTQIKWDIWPGAALRSEWTDWYMVGPRKIRKLTELEKTMLRLEGKI
jgi:hypothetical protein